LYNSPIFPHKNYSILGEVPERPPNEKPPGTTEAGFHSYCLNNSIEALKGVSNGIRAEEKLAPAVLIRFTLEDLCRTQKKSPFGFEGPCPAKITFSVPILFPKCSSSPQTATYSTRVRDQSD